MDELTADERQVLIAALNASDIALRAVAKTTEDTKQALALYRELELLASAAHKLGLDR